ncbi:terminase family protein [Candidatus Bathyarchaeota archaeon]|nr:terminase family protein [Candidatus Bathyarchaeota archaeon]
MQREFERVRLRLDAEDAVKVPEDPVQFCVDWLGYTPFIYMWPFLQDPGHFVANVQARQTGKTFNGMAKLLWYAFRYPKSLILVTAPKFDQAKNIAFKALGEHLHRMKTRNPELFNAAVGDKNVLRTIVRLRNGSQILAESPVPETIRGHTAKVIYLMEANFIRDDEDLYTAVLFTLNTTNGYLIAESTPWNTDSIFYRMFHDPAYGQFSKHRVVYTEALPPHGPLSPDIVEMIEKQLAGDPARWRREMLCEWTEDLNVWLPTSLITLSQDSALEYLDATEPARGEFYIGVDFGKHQDYSVVAVLNKRVNHLHLIHCHQFALETSYGAVIGYIKRLQDNWKNIRAVYADKTGVGDYIVEDMQRGGLRNVEGINFTETSKEEMATCLKEQMRSAVCPRCGWTGYVDTLEGEWRTTCPQGCRSGEGNPVNLRPLLHVPYDGELFHELNAERFELGKTGKILFNHPEGTHDDRFWAVALAVYAAEQAKPPPSKPIAKT